MIDLILTWLSKRSKSSVKKDSQYTRPESATESGTIHPTAQKFFNMSSSQKKEVHLCLAGIALTQWRKFIACGAVPRSYTESVCGTCQKIDLNLPSDAMTCVRDKTDPSQISERYLEPITALHDDDWSLPDDPQYAFYTIYNTFQKYALGKEIDDWLIVNQALSSLGEDSPEIEITFEDAINKVA